MMLLYFVCMFGLAGANSLRFDKLDDGIIVSHRANVSIIEGEWTVLLTIRESGASYRLDIHKRLAARAKQLE